jgi:4-hydroxybenzoate polyprenyltransferase
MPRYGFSFTMGIAKSLRTTLEMIKFEHSVFALPFALTGAVLAARGLPAWRTLAWIVVAMVAARSAAMSFNRIADARLDAANPRTAARALPTGVLSRRFVALFTAVSAVVFVLAARQLNPLCFRLSPVALVILLLYSYTKRFTVLSHLLLGFCLGMAPAAAWIAVRGTLEWPILLLTTAVMLWTAGFDIIYACQDVEFDRQTGLRSLPACLGVGRALRIATFFHLLMLGLLVALALIEHLGWISLSGLAAVTALLAYEHSLVRPNDLSKVNAAFFTVNGYISVLFFLFWALDVAVLG